MSGLITTARVMIMTARIDNKLSLPGLFFLVLFTVFCLVHFLNIQNELIDTNR